MSATAVRAVWLTLLAACLLGPVALVLATGPGEPSSIWDDLTVITGAQAAALIAFVIAFASRLRTVTRAFGIDDTVAAHRLLGSLALVLVLVHLLAVIADDPGHVWLLSGLEAPARAAAGLGACLGLGAVVFLARWRGRLGYESWRRSHHWLAAGAVILTALHVLWLDRLIYDRAWAGAFLAMAGAVALAWALRWLIRPLSAGRGLMVVDVRPVSEHASAVRLRPLRGKRWCFRPGQFAWLRLHRSVWSEDHPFSMSSAPGRTVEFTVAHRGDWTRGPLRSLRPGARVWLDGPHGSVTLDRASGDILILICAGVGIAPMLSMLRTMEATHDPRQVRLIVPPTYLFPAEIAVISRRLRLITYPVLTKSITPAALAEYLPEDHELCDVFVCGSPQLIDDTEAALEAINFPSGRVHAERFGLAEPARS